MFSSAVRTGTRLKAWNTNPSRSRRRRVSALSSSVASSAPSTWTEPEVEATTKDCGHCLSSIPLAATVCAFCTRDV